MQDTFARLREELEAVDRWLAIYLTLHLSEKERETAVSLQRYVKHCFRDEKKWRSESAAERARLKVNRAWYELYVRQKRRR